MSNEANNQFSDSKKREGWDSEDLSEEASQKDEDEIKRQMNRGDESKGNPDDRDEVGAVDTDETAHGREEAKNDKEGKANVNG